MAEGAAKAERYRRILAQAQELLRDVPRPIARMSTVAALLHHKMQGFSWTGFYLLEGDELVVGPYQGLLACIVLEKPRGVCWAGILRGEPVLVPDVHAFPGHIACDSRSRSEIVVPVRRADGSPAGVLDVDSTRPAWFDETDALGLAPLAALVHAGSG
ncbi:MAG: GAF domain-containing protein [Acidobacteriia bacterium]|nr:GAF domain-containing protein [Terriglobia bacterium]